MTKQIPLTQGKFALVDDEDFEFLNQWKWNVNAHGYARRLIHISGSKKNRKRKSILMHRVINKTPDGLQTDHLNRDRLDNRKQNLRDATSSQNHMNTLPRKGSSSKYKGVFWHKKANKWMAQIRVNGILTYLGLFISEIEAAKAYDEFAFLSFGSFSKPNVSR